MKSACEDRCAEDGAKTTGEFHSVPLPVGLRFALKLQGFAVGGGGSCPLHSADQALSILDTNGGDLLHESEW